MGTQFVIEADVKEEYNANYPYLMLRQVVAEVVTGLPTAHGPLILVENGVVSTYQQEEIYNACPLPHKYIVDCSGCLESDNTVYVCPVKKAHLTWYNDDECSAVSARDVLEWAKKKKNQLIEGFKYVSPTMTAGKPFQPNVRALREHYFSDVEHNVKERSEASQRGADLVKFKRTICTQCLLGKSCLSGASRVPWMPKSCEGKVKLESWEEYSDLVLKTYTTPHTDEELAWISYNSGLLEKRINRRIYYLTLAAINTRYHYKMDVEEKILVTAALRPKRGGVDIPLPSMEAVHEAMKGTGKEPPEHLRSLDKNAKALLLECASLKNSPVHVSRWRSTEYPVMYVRSGMGGFVRVYFSWPRRAHQLTPWDLEIDQPIKLFNHYGPSVTSTFRNVIQRKY